MAALPIAKAAATAKAGNHGVMEIIGRRFVTYPQPERSEAEWAAWWQDHYDVLADLTREALEAALQAVLHDPAVEFLPKPGKIRELALQAVTPSGKLYAALAKAVPQTAAVVDQSSRPPPTDDERAAVKAMMADFSSQAAAKTPAAQRPQPATHGAADETGLTPAMREILAKRQSESNP